MFANWLARLVPNTTSVHRRPEGAAFLTVTKGLYGCSAMAYLAVNIPVRASRGRFMHCAYSDSCVGHCVTERPLNAEPVVAAGANVASAADWHPGLEASDGRDTGNGHDGGARRNELIFPIRPKAGETAIFGIAADMIADDRERYKNTRLGEVRILANYFHSHVLRINGFNAETELLVSARELDCLKWTTAGKTAWEASVILGISERTVRFHLNAAREKLKCATTAQAVAKAVGYQLIDI
jgi:DNA-binding CsgD family transcriptional regulator